MNCRHCRAPLQHRFLDLGFAPHSNGYRSEAQLRMPETHYPLRLFVCDRCWLLQTEDYSSSRDLFTEDYAYFSSVSKSWLAHAAAYAAAITRRLSLDKSSFVIEVASNDGYLLKNFVQAGIPCLGIEPTVSTAEAAERIGVPTVREFFGERFAQDLAASGKQADLIAGNNILAHVPDINDFVSGLRHALKPDGTITLEFPHLLELIRQTQFDTIYHEHFSYLSLFSVQRIFEAAGLRIYDVERLATHGGSLRIYACQAAAHLPPSTAVQTVLDDEGRAGLRDLDIYQSFQARADAVKNGFLQFLLEQRRQGKRVAGYGAAAKGVTLLNYAGVRPDLLPFVCDAAPSKQGKYLPGCHIPICDPARLRAEKPDFIVIFPWNIAAEIRSDLSHARSWNGKFVTAVPSIQIFEAQ
jgi:SAM-dependent methyltransferase